MITTMLLLCAAPAVTFADAPGPPPTPPPDAQAPAALLQLRGELFDTCGSPLMAPRT